MSGNWVEGDGASSLPPRGALLRFCCDCSRRERHSRAGNTWVVLSAALPPEAQARVRRAFEALPLVFSYARDPGAANASSALVGRCIRFPNR